MSELKEKILYELGFTYAGLSGKTQKDFGRGMPFIPFMNIMSNGKIDPKFFNYVDVASNENQNAVQIGDLFFTTSSETPDEVGMTSVLLEDIGECYLNSFCFGFRLYNFNDLIPEFAPYLFRGNEVRKQIINLGQGYTRFNLPKTELLKKLKLNLPSISEQRKISKILTTADTVIEKTQATIAKYKVIKQGMLQDLFTRGIDITTNKLRPRFEDAPQLYRESKLGMIPREWVVKQLGELCSMKSGDGITSEKIYEMGDYPVYGGNGLRGFTSKFTHEGEYTLIGRQGALCGNITRVSGKFYASEHAVTVTPENNVELDWLSQKLFNMNLNQYSEATAQPGLSVFKILPLLAETPTFDEQQRIAERLKSIDHKLQIEQTYLQKKQLIKKGLMEDLLSGKKCLNLDLQDEQMNKIDSGKETVDNPINPKIK